MQRWYKLKIGRRKGLRNCEAVVLWAVTERTVAGSPCTSRRCSDHPISQTDYHDAMPAIKLVGKLS
jgi:hypothetical protein